MVLETIIAKFKGVSLAQMDSVKLMNRTDRKYWFGVENLGELLEDIKDDYYLLEIDGSRNMPYSTSYYDTIEDDMYNNHHRGKKNRYKIRRRNYISTQSSFLEVKFKSNKGRTIKVRRASDYNNPGFDTDDCNFIKENTPYSSNELEMVLVNRFRRLMLVSKEFNERCTIDSQLWFSSGESSASLEGLVVVEVKTDGRSHSAIIDALNSRRIKSSGFSKYCMGRSIVCNNLKYNRFKSKHREIEKKINTQINNIVSYGN